MTPDAIERACKAARAGLSKRHQAAVAGVSESTYYRWLRADMTYASEEYDQGRAAYEQAEAERAMMLMEVVDKAATEAKDWKAAVWSLQQLGYSKAAETKVEHSGAVETGPQVVVRLAPALARDLAIAEDDGEE